MTSKRSPAPSRRGGRAADQRAATANPADPAVTARAFRTVLTYTIADVFGLLVEETLWTGYHLDDILRPLAKYTPHRLPIAVRRELLERVYSDALSAAEKRDSDAVALPADPATMSADIVVWAAVLSETVTQSYRLRPMDESTILGRITGLLRELGVGDPANPRGARYLPNNVRQRLADRAANGTT